MDGIPDGREVEMGLDPTKIDSDGDGYSDQREMAAGTDGGDPESYPGSSTTPDPDDTDGDGLTNEEELQHGTDPNNADTDNDGLKDSWEVKGEAPGGVDLPGADPLHKDLYLEIVYHQDASEMGASQKTQLRENWAEMPVDNPDGSKGIDLHLIHSSHGKINETYAGSGRYFWQEYYRDNYDADRKGVYYMTIITEFESQYDAIGGDTDRTRGKMKPASVVNKDANGRVDIITHEVLHSVVGKLQTDKTCKNQYHTCEGYLAPYTGESGDFLPEYIAAEIAEEGL